MGSIQLVRFHQLCFLLVEIWICTAMTTSMMRPVGDISAADACGDNLLPEPLSCQAAFLPNLLDGGAEQGVEVELSCSWSHEYPVQYIRFKHGFDIIEPQMELDNDMTVITRRVFQASERDLSVVGFFCDFSFLHPLCGPVDERSSCSIARAEIRSDPLIREVTPGGTAQVSCHKRNNVNTAQEEGNITWQTKKDTQNKFFPLTNGSRRTISEDRSSVKLYDVRAGDNLILVRCNVEGNVTTKNYGLSQIRVVEATTVIGTVPTNPATRVPITSPTTHAKILSTSVLQPRTERVINTNTPTSVQTLITNPTPKIPIFENIYLTIIIILVPVIIFFGICIIIMMVRYRRKKKVPTESRSVPLESRTVPDNTYEYEANDNAIEHEYFQSYHCVPDDTTSQHSEYVNDRMLQGAGRTTRMLRSRSDSRLAQMAEAISLKDLPKSQSAWALPGLSAEVSFLDRPMPEMPSRKRSMTANAAMRPPLPRRDHPQRYSHHEEYAMIDDTILSRSLDISDTQPYACTQLHPRSQTLDPKVFIPKRKQKK